MYRPQSRHRCLALFAALLLMAGTSAGAEPQIIRLWDGPAPGSPTAPPDETVRVTEGGDHVISNVHVPSITAYLPNKGATGAAVAIAPGGGRSSLWIDHEGYTEAAWLADHGVAAFVLKYRLARMPTRRTRLKSIRCKTRSGLFGRSARAARSGASIRIVSA